MTIDKIAHYIGQEQTIFICQQPAEKLQAMQKQLLYEINEVSKAVKTPHEILFKYKMELELVKKRLSVQ